MENNVFTVLKYDTDILVTFCQGKNFVFARERAGRDYVNHQRITDITLYVMHKSI